MSNTKRTMLSSDLNEATNSVLNRLSSLSINPSNSTPQASISSAHQAPTSAAISPILAEQIKKLVVAEMNFLANPTIDNNDFDEMIDPAKINDLTGMEKIPDVVKSLREFSGQLGEFSSWKKSVERILQIYEPIRGTPKYYGILSVIRNKITGYADIALESYNTPLNWCKISKCLALHYADKRDLGTLEYQLTTLVQNNNTIPEFYQQVYQHLSLILNKLSCMDMSNDSLSIMTETYRQKALDTFIRGLRGDLPKLLSIREPVNLPQALHLCLKLDNVNYRTQHAINSQTLLRRPNNPIGQPARRNFAQALPHRNQFFPELACTPNPIKQFRSPEPPLRQNNNYPQRQQNYSNHNQWNQNHNLSYSPQANPEPMDVDKSLHSRMINYQNRQNFMKQNTSQKRFNESEQIHSPNKFQRIFHTETENNQDIDQDVCQSSINHIQPENEINLELCDDISRLESPSLNNPSLPYYEFKSQNGKVFKFLLDTGSNKNYIQPCYIRNPLLNKNKFYANSIGGKITVTHHSDIDIFGNNIGKIKFFILPGLKSFDGIIGFDTLKELGAVIHTHKNYFTLLNNHQFAIKQFKSQVNNFDVTTSHLNLNQEKQRTLTEKFPNPLCEPNKKLIYPTVAIDSKPTCDKPIYSKRFPHSSREKNDVNKQLNARLDNGVIPQKDSNINFLSEIEYTEQNPSHTLTPAVEKFINAFRRQPLLKQNKKYSYQLKYPSYGFNKRISADTNYTTPKTKRRPDEYKKTRQSNIEKLKQKQTKDLRYQNKNRHNVKNYNIGDVIYVKHNKRLGSKLTQRFDKEIVAENKKSTVKTQSGRTVHKNHIRN